MVHRRWWVSGLVLLASSAAGAPAPAELKDLYFGEALYHAYQGDHFDAIARLDDELTQYYKVDESRLDPLHFHVRDAEFSLGDFELSYRMHQRAGRAIRTLIDGDVEPPVRNEAAYRLARIYFQKGQPVEALQALDRISGELPAGLHGNADFLRAQLYMAVGRFADAVPILMDLHNKPSLEGFADYNLGVALLQAGRVDEGRDQLARTGQVPGDDPAILTIRDKSNLVLGNQLLEAHEFEDASEHFNRVHLTGPFSNRALLSSGWAEAESGHYERALVPWTVLATRNVTDKAVQEALLALPYAYSKLNVHGKAALLYGNAMDAFNREVDRLQTSIHSIQQGKFLEAVLREELKQDSNWIIKLRELPDAPETWYLTELVASNEFQESLKNYLDLNELRRKLSLWSDYLEAYEDLVAHRRAYYEPLLPDIDRQFRVLDTRLKLRLQQRDRLHSSLQAMLVAPRPDLLATAEERETLESLARIRATSEGSERVNERLERLNGVVQWSIHTEYHERLTRAYRHLRELDADIEALKKTYDAFVRSRQAVTQSYVGYGDSIEGLKTRARLAHDKVVALMAKQGHLLEAMAVEELDRRLTRLEDYQVQARFAMADSYDRAIRLQEAERSQ